MTRARRYHIRMVTLEYLARLVGELEFSAGGLYDGLEDEVEAALAQEIVREVSRSLRQRARRVPVAR